MIHPRIYHVFSCLIVLAFLAAGLATVDDYGMSWDEVVRWNSGDLKLAYYQKLMSGEAGSLEQQMAGDRYPGLFDLPLAAWHAARGGDRLRQGHVLSIAFGALGLAATCWLATQVFGARTGLFAVLILAVMPHFYGHAMINPKDIPFMATYTLGLAMIFHAGAALVRQPRVAWGRFALAGLAIGLAGASRVPGLVLLPMAAAAWAAACLYGGWRHKRPLRPAPALLLLARALLPAGAAAFAVVLLFFPRAQFQLFSSLPAVARTLHSSADAIPLLFAGRVSDAGDGPFAYAHRFLLISTPLWMLALLAGGTLLLLRSLARGPGVMTIHYFLQALLLAAAAFPWAYILVTQPALHNGIRHMLFGIPPLVVLMAHAADRILEALRARRPYFIAAATAFAALLLLQAAHLVRMHPYPYVSFNLLAGDPATIPDRYEAEYWFTSTRHLLEALPEVAPPPAADGTPAPVKVRVAGPLNAARPFVPPGYILTDSLAEADYFVANTTFRTDLLADGEVVHEIVRGGIPIGVIKRLHRQAPSPEPEVSE